MNDMKKSIGLVTTFSKDAGLEFNQNKCYIVVKREKIKNQTSNGFMNYLTVSPVSEEKCYTWLKMDEHISYNGQL